MIGGHYSDLIRAGLPPSASCAWGGRCRLCGSCGRRPRGARHPCPGTHCAGRAALPCVSGSGGRCIMGLSTTSEGFPPLPVRSGGFSPPMARSVGVQPLGAQAGRCALQGGLPAGHPAPAPHCDGLMLRGSPLRWQWGLPGWPARRACYVGALAPRVLENAAPPSGLLQGAAAWWARVLPPPPCTALACVRMGCVSRAASRAAGRAAGGCGAGGARGSGRCEIAWVGAGGNFFSLSLRI